MSTDKLPHDLSDSRNQLKCYNVMTIHCNQSFSGHTKNQTTFYPSRNVVSVTLSSCNAVCVLHALNKSSQFSVLG